MYEQNAVNPVIVLPGLRDARGNRSYAVMLVVAALLHGMIAPYLSRPVQVRDVVAAVDMGAVSFSEQNMAPDIPVDPSYRPEVANVLPPDNGPGPGGPDNNGVVNNLQAKMNGLVIDPSQGGDVIRISDNQASLDSLLLLAKSGRPGNGQPGVGWRRVVGPQPVPFYKVEVKPQPVSIPAPGYPEMVRSAGIEGSAVVEALLDVDGSVMEVRILKSAGNQMLDAAASDAARKARFTPAKQRDKPVRVWISIPYRFILTK